MVNSGSAGQESAAGQSCFSLEVADLRSHGYDRGRAGVALSEFLKEIRYLRRAHGGPASGPMEEVWQRRFVALLEGFAAGQEDLVHQSRSMVEDLEARNRDLTKRADESLPTRVAELAALHKVNSAANSSLDLDDVLSLTVDAVAEVMKSDVCSIYIYQPDRDELVLQATSGLSQEAAAAGQVALKLGEGVTGWAAKEGRPVAVRDAWSDPHFRYFPGLHEEEPRSQLSVPIILFSQEMLQGVINIQTRDYRDFSKEEVDFLEMVAGEIAMAIENARLYQETDDKLRQKVRELTMLQRVSAAIAATLELPEVLNLIATQAVELSSASVSAIFAVDEQSGALTAIASHGLDRDILADISVQPGDDVIRKVVENGTPVSVMDAEHDERLSPTVQVAAEEGYHSMLCLPLITPRGTLGGLCLYAEETHAFKDEELGLLSAFANEAAIAIENARLYEETRRGLDVKSALLQEMHHRVRNNLQTVAALLSMQLRRAKMSPAEGPLGESITRIQSIAAVHDLLSGEQLGQTTVREIARQVFDAAAVTLVPPGKQIDFNLDSADVLVGSREATLIAIIINELLTNAIRHAFADTDRGTIRIEARREDGRTRIEVTDDGHGYPPEFDLKEKAGLGLQIVQTLVSKDLNGEFTLVSTETGTRSVLDFPNEH